jgi:hypothetical protein
MEKDPGEIAASHQQVGPSAQETAWDFSRIQKADDLRKVLAGMEDQDVRPPADAQRRPVGQEFVAA